MHSVLQKPSSRYNEDILLIIYYGIKTFCCFKKHITDPYKDATYYQTNIIGKFTQGN